MLGVIESLENLRPPITSVGRVLSVKQGYIEVDGICPSIGDRCYIESSSDSQEQAEAEVIAISGKVSRATLTSSHHKIRRNDRVICPIDGHYGELNVDASLAIDANGKTIAARSKPLKIGDLSMFPRALAVPERGTVKVRMVTTENAIDDGLPLGFGQRVGIFAEAGAGKSMLLRKLMAEANCDHVVYTMIGERSREVIEAIRYVESESIDHRVTMVVGLAGDPAPLRARAMTTSLAIAQHMARQGGNVLHLVDSLTRFAYAIREIGLASGEPMAQSGMTPSVYQRIPECLEMAGNWKDSGSVTTVAAVLLESQLDDPMSSYVRSLLDGHIYLDKEMSDRGIFPSIDVLRSRSRLDTVLLDETQQTLAKSVRTDLIAYKKIEEYLHFSGYEAGTSPSMDLKVSRHEKVLSWIQNEIATDSLQA
jgi:flagellum-specific ATP synthase